MSRRDSDGEKTEGSFGAGATGNEGAATGA